MMLERLRWTLLPVAAIALLVVVFKGASPGRLALAAICSLAWYGLSRRKTYSLDRDRFAGGKLGRRSS
jgi:EamA domain-containing membrane protein RarD